MSNGTPEVHSSQVGLSRRDFVKASTLAAAAVSVPATSWAGNLFHARGSDTIRMGMIGCGGRGTGAAGNSLNASPNIRIVAMGDVFKERLDSSLANLKSDEYTIPHADRIDVKDEHKFVGFDAYKQVLASDVDAVILATPPHFRPIHFAAAIDAGKHVFFEKPVAVDAAGIRAVIAAGEKAAQKNLACVTGTQRRHENCYLEAMTRLRGGAIGKVLSARCYWNQGSLWMHPREAAWTDMEWQLKNWLYFTWLSGDHIVEQHVHNLDVCNWAIDAHPLKAWAMGGREVRKGPEYGHVFDHFAVEYEYPGGVTMNSFCRQIEGCADRVEEFVQGTEGTMLTRSGQAMIDGKTKWKYSGDSEVNPYQQEHVDMIKSIMDGKPLNEAKRIAESTLTAIMGRMAAYTGKMVTWEQALNSKENLAPAKYEFASLPVPPVAVPGRTLLI